MPERMPHLYLCAGLQSSGSTLISWCFCQRSDMDGAVDANNDILHEVDPTVGQPHVWVKTTIGPFRLTELAAHYRDLGWPVTPLLVIRDVRDVWASLIAKPYARHATTAEDPPLRLRLRRFLDDWQRFEAEGGAMIRFERFVAEPEAALRQACAAMGLAWDGAMLSWPKPPGQIADPRHGNATFHASLGGGLHDSLRRDAARRPDRPCILPGDLAWLESTFAAFNEANGYPAHRELALPADDPDAVALPSYEHSRRLKWERARKPMHYLLYKLGRRDRTLRRGRIGRR